MPQIQLIARYTLPSDPAQTAAALALIAELAEASRAEPGNLAYETYRALDDDRRVVLLERYTDRDAVDAHRASPHFRRLVIEGLVPMLAGRVVEEIEVPETAP